MPHFADEETDRAQVWGFTCGHRDAPQLMNLDAPKGGLVCSQQPARNQREQRAPLPRTDILGTWTKATKSSIS